MPLLPTRKVDTDAGTPANAGELKPVTALWAHLDGVTLTPFMESLVALTSASEPYAPDSTGAAGASPLILPISAFRSWAAVYVLVVLAFAALSSAACAV